jgi:hypothetical protein
MARLLPLILLAACAPTGKTPSSTGGADLRVFSDLDPSSPDPVEGGLGLFVVHVRNVSKRFVILLEMALPDGTPVLSWENAPPRPLAYDPARDEFHQESGPRSAAEVVHVGLLLPGESLLFRPQVRLLGLPRRYHLKYVSYASPEIAQNVYFEQRDGRDLRYRRMPAAQIGQLVPVPEPAATHRSVVFPHADSPLESPRRADLVLTADAAARKFRLADALDRLKATPDAVVESTYCVYLGGWAVRTKEGAWLVTPRGAVPLPRISGFELCFFHLDTIEPHLGAQFEFTGALDVRFPDRNIVLLREQNRIRKLAFIMRDALPGFLKELKEKDLEVHVRVDRRAPSLVVRTPASEGDRTFPFSEALRKIGLTSAEVLEHVWSSALGAWAVRSRSGSWYVSARGAGALPEMPWFAHFLRRLDDLGDAESVRFDLPADLAMDFPYARDGAVRREDLARFLSEAKQKGLKAEVSPAGAETPFRLVR